ncbi:hypothetical protein ACFCYN_20985 [Gottfriedia sp. NPDC056225]|uniref:hypothetical protein n=1 Tax=Gottfriedia sp. NPDC056225 TaxID=3345751 RepID=UPI0035D61A13
MKRILILLFCALLLFGCSMNTKPKSKINQIIGLVGVTSNNTIIYSADNDSDLINSIKKGFDTHKLEIKQIDIPDLRLTFINGNGKKEVYEVNYKHSVYTYEGEIYKLDSRTKKVLQEKFMN